VAFNALKLKNLQEMLLSLSAFQLLR